MSLDLGGVHVVDALYRVSTRAQESEGESLFNQRRAIEDWAAAHGITLRETRAVVESAKTALRFRKGGFDFGRRLSLREMLERYERGADLPDAVCVDWSDRWSRSTLDFEILVTAFRHFGLRLLSVSDQVDLTDPSTHLMSSIKSAVAQEQLRVTSDKVKENRRSRRDRARWQGGRVADGYRTHAPDCSGRVSVTREGPDGVPRTYSVRGCSCRTDVLYRDPARESTIVAVWSMLATSPLSWEGIAQSLNAAGHRKKNGSPFRWGDLYRIGENPHYAGTMTTDRWETGRDVGRYARMKRLSETPMRPSDGSIVDAYVSEDEFWRIHQSRFTGERRHLRRSKRGGSNELVGLVVCPVCRGRMTSVYAMSSKTTRHGRVRKAPIKRYAYLLCAAAKANASACAAGRRRYRVDTIGKLLVEHLAALTVMSDADIVRALTIRESGAPRETLRRDLMRLQRERVALDKARQQLRLDLARGDVTTRQYASDLKALRSSDNDAQRRVTELEAQLGEARARPSFANARKTISWLGERWGFLTAAERGEMLRLLVSRLTVAPDGTPVILQYGVGFVDVADSLRLDAAG